MIGDNADTTIGMGVIGRMQVVVRCERVPPLSLCTPERQSLCESHRRRRWLTCWSYYADASLCQRLSMTTSELHQARQALITRGLVAYQRPLYQILALDAVPIGATP